MLRFLIISVIAILLVSLCAPAGARHHRHTHFHSRHSDLTEALPREGFGPEGWTIYSDERTGITIVYPANIFSVDGGTAKQGTGKQFRTADGHGALTIYVLDNENDYKPSSYLEDHLALDRKFLHRKRTTSSFFELSGAQEDTADRLAESATAGHGCIARCLFVRQSSGYGRVERPSLAMCARWWSWRRTLTISKPPAQVHGQRWVALWRRLYGETIADSQQAIAAWWTDRKATSKL